MGWLLMDMQPCTATLAAVRAAGVEAKEVLGDLSDEAVVRRGGGGGARTVGAGGCAGE